MSNNILKIGIPKGSLEKATIELFQNAGWKISVSSRNYFPSIDDNELSCSLVRAQEMARYVESGVLDAGLTGLDWIMDTEADVELISDLVYSKVSTQKARWVLAVPANSDIKTLEDLTGKTISTELVNYTRRFFNDRNIQVNVEFSWGTTEAKVAEGLVDAIVEVTETGTTIKAHGLRIIYTLFETNTKFIANKNSMLNSWKKNKIRQVALLLQGALNAENMVGLKMNLSPENMEDLIKILPSLNAPTVAGLYNSDWVSVEVVVEAKIVRNLIPKLIEVGAEGIIEYPLNKVI